MENFIKELQGPMQVNFYPTRRLLDALTWVIRPPSLDKAETQDTETAKVIHTDTSRCRQTDSWSYSTHRPRTRDCPSHRRGLSCGCCLRRGRLLLHLAVTLSQIEHLDVGSGVDFVHGIPRGPACLPIQVVTLYEDGVVAETAHPDITLSAALQLNALPDVKPGPLAGVSSMHIGQLTQTESVTSGRVYISVHCDNGAVRWHLKDFSDLDVHLEVGDRTPELRTWVIGNGVLVLGGALVEGPVLVGMVKWGLLVSSPIRLHWIG